MNNAIKLEPIRADRGVFAQSHGSGRRLHTNTDQRGSAIILRTRGEVDAYTLSYWLRIVRETVTHASAPGPVIVDITGLQFISGSALAALAKQAEICQEQSINLIAVTRASTVHRVAIATGLDAYLSIYSSADAALHAAASGNSAARHCGRCV